MPNVNNSHFGTSSLVDEQKSKEGALSMPEKKHMHAIAITAFGGPEQLTLVEQPLPTPDQDEVLIRVQAAGVGMWDVKVRQGKVIFEGQQFPFIPGWESAGVIEQVGAKVTGWRVGDVVTSFTEQAGIGHYAEYVAVPAHLTAAAPTSVDALHAAALPVNGLTAYQSLTETLALRAGETILITAASGGTGSFAVQLAARLGAHVIAVASTHNHAYLSELGASELIDYTQTDMVTAVRATHAAGIDAVLDCVGGKTAASSLEVLREGGRMVSIVDLELVKPRKGISTHLFYVRPDGKQLGELAHLVDTQRLSIHLDQVFPLAEARQAHQRLEGRHNRGKIVLDV
jgi:NADPH:quinone reductase